MIDAFDSHCHLDVAEFDDDRDAVWSRAREGGVAGALVPAVRPADWGRTRACALPGERWVALGIHPVYLDTMSDDELRNGLDGLSGAIRAAPGAVAVGECGLDGNHDLAPQRAVFRAHIEVAAALDLPLVVHAYRCHGEVLDVLRAQRLPSRPGVIHSFSGSAELAREYLALGFHLSFAGAVTRPNARRPLEALRATPRGRLLVETDAPDQRPTGVTREGTRCEPCDLAAVVARAAEALGVSADALAAETARNARALFGV